jgi:hypothetical protein
VRKRILLSIVIAAAVATVACRGGKGEGETAAVDTTYTPPPVEYVVGKMDVDDDAAEPSVRMSVAVDPSTPRKDIERLLNYFDKDKYDDYDIVWVDVYFDVARARSPEADPAALVATLRVNRPGFRELKVADELAAEGEMPGAQPEVTSQTEETLYLGRRGRMFGSAKQAQALVDFMEDKPGYAIYRIVWQSPGNTELTYSVEQELLVRVKADVSRETWAGMSYEDIRRAARGSGFGGRRRHGADYTFIRESAEEAEGE